MATEEMNMNNKNGEEKTKEAQIQEEMEEVQQSENREDSAELSAEESELEKKEEKKPVKEEVDYKSRCLYLAAEMDNMQKRNQRDKESLIKYSNEKILTELVDVMDNLERTIAAVANDPDDKIKNIVRGVEMIRKQFEDVLARYGLSSVEALGKVFDPNFHEAVAQRQSDNADDHQVLEVYQKGYVLGERLLRAAKVVVCAK